MCGIAGIVNFSRDNPVPLNILERMGAAMAHRGPDDSGVFVDGNVGLAHRRLSIIDLENGKQPLANEDETLWIVFNGEIYNYRELRGGLEAKGHVFRTRSDTEVIVHLFEDRGPDCLQQLNGMFAFAIYDRKSRNLFIARDRLGQKPIFYFQTKDSFVFASELAALKKHPAMPREINPQAVHEYFSLEYVPSPGTVYHNVNKVPPGHYIELNVLEKSSRARRYWTVDYSLKRNISFQHAKEMLTDILGKSVRRRLVSDVPVGAFLSGGVDSSVIASLIAGMSSRPLRTFTIGFKEKLYDERKHAESVALHLAAKGQATIEHSANVVEPVEFELIGKLVERCGEPFGDSSILPTYLLSQYVSEHVKVALSGDGADELFAGYYRYLLMKFAKLGDFIPQGLRSRLAKVVGDRVGHGDERSPRGRLYRLLKLFGAPRDSRYLSIISRCEESVKMDLYGDAFDSGKLHATQSMMNALFNIATARDPVEKLLEVDLHSYLPCDILTKVDVASMANSLEVRNPFMDHEVVEFAASLPLSFKQRGRQRKHILREAFRDTLPREVLNREKMGFGVPLAEWFRKRWDQPLRDCLLGGDAVADGYIRRQPVENLIKEHQTMRHDHSHTLWLLIVFEHFLKIK